MKLSQFVKRLADDLATNGDTEHVSLCLSVPGSDGNRYRIDAVLAEDASVDVLRDPNVANGMACLVADYEGAELIRAPLF